MFLRLNKGNDRSVASAQIKKCLTGNNEEKIVVCIATNYEEGNYGDLLSRYIVEQLSGKEVVKYLENNVEHLCAVGSVLNRNEMCSNAVVWGSGFLSPQAQYKVALTKIRQWLRGKAGRPVYLAVRGKKTRDILVRAGYACPEIYADPALLLPKIYNPQITPKYKLGIVLHWSQGKFADMFAEIAGMKLIPINRRYGEINSFIDDILQCETVLSSSLHGLILANAYKIPCVRLKILQNPIATSERKDDFKFEDYLSGLNSCKHEKERPDYTFDTLFLKPGDKQNETLIDCVKEVATTPQFGINLTPLLQAFPFLKEKYKNKKFIVS